MVRYKYIYNIGIRYIKLCTKRTNIKYDPITLYTMQSCTKSTRQNSDQHPHFKLWGCWIRDVPISFGTDVRYCLGRDPYSSGLWECWMIGIFSILLLVLDTIDKWYSDN